MPPGGSALLSGLGESDLEESALEGPSGREADWEGALGIADMKSVLAQRFQAGGTGAEETQETQAETREAQGRS